MAKAKETESGISIINRHIKDGEFANVYLMMGEQKYLINQFTKKLSDALVDTSANSMNYMRLRKDNIKVSDISEFAMELPFLSDRRVVEIWDSGFFKTGNEEMENLINELPETTTLIFVEEKVDRKFKLYKLVDKVGTVAVFDAVDDNTLMVWIKNSFAQEGFAVSDDAIRMLHFSIGNDMAKLATEIEKLKSYCADTKKVSANDVTTMCENQVESKIFDMIDNLCQKNRSKAIKLYDDLLTLKEPAVKMLVLITKQYERLVKVRMLMDEGCEYGKIASAAGIPVFTVKKYMDMCRNCTANELLDKVNLCQECDNDIKTGRSRDAAAVDILVMKLLK